MNKWPLFVYSPLNEADQTSKPRPLPCTDQEESSHGTYKVQPEQSLPINRQTPVPGTPTLTRKDFSSDWTEWWQKWDADQWSATTLACHKREKTSGVDLWKQDLPGSWDHRRWTNRDLLACSLTQTCAHTPLTPDVWNGEALRPQVELHADTQQKSKQKHDCLIQLIQFSPNWSKCRGVSAAGPITSNQRVTVTPEFHSTAHANLCSENQLERPFAFFSFFFFVHSDQGQQRGKQCWGSERRWNRVEQLRMYFYTSAWQRLTWSVGAFCLEEHLHAALLRPRALQCGIVQHSFYITKHFGGFNTVGNEVEGIWQWDVLAADLTKCHPLLQQAAR